MAAAAALHPHHHNSHHQQQQQQNHHHQQQHHHHQQQQQQQHHHHQQQQQYHHHHQQRSSTAATVFANDEMLKAFLQRLQKRGDDSESTVPVALSRRMLQSQGVGFLDDTVGALASAAADRFLATVLQQAVACRDQRLQGAELAKEETRQRRKHQLLYQQDADDRKRRKLARTQARLKANLAAIAAANDLRRGGGATSPTPTTEGSTSKSSKKKKNKKEENGEATPVTLPIPPKAVEDGEESSDGSLEDEELYYQDFWGGPYGWVDNEEDEDDESRFMLLLRDLQLPLQAWDFDLTGKLGLGVIPLEAEEEVLPDEVDLEHETENGSTMAMAADATATSATTTTATTIAAAGKLENGESGENLLSSSPAKSQRNSPVGKDKMVENGPRSAAASRANTPVADRVKSPINAAN